MKNARQIMKQGREVHPQGDGSFKVWLIKKPFSYRRLGLGVEGTEKKISSRREILKSVGKRKTCEM